jgi:hypothetical protein
MIARRRADMLKVWVTKIQQPKHLVLTMKNFPILTRWKIREFGKAVGKLRRNKVWKSVKGGCLSIEITNEGRGWHLHGHMLIDARWLNMQELSIEWGKLVGQQFAICKVLDCRGQCYLGEVTKYVVKPAELVGWEPEQIGEFIGAIRGVRFFLTFGTLFKMARQVRAEIENMKPAAAPCECGCEDWMWTGETEEAIRDAGREAKRRGH